MEEKKPFKFPTEADLPKTVESCHDLIRDLYKIITELFNRVEKLELENRELKERLNNNSSNSSLPPSKDYKKKKKQRPASQNPSGGQKGHRGYFRALAPSEEVDQIVTCPLPSHCLCGGNIKAKETHQRHQVYELPVLKLHLTEYRLEKGFCGECGRSHIGSLPEGVTWGITGPNLTSFMSHLVSRYRLSRRELNEFLKEHFNFKISLGTVFNKQKIVNTALAKSVNQLLEELKQAPSINIDETGHNRDGKKAWMWGVMSPAMAFFSIAASRGKKVLKSLVGDFKNVVTSDRYSAYNYFDSDKRQICWAHLKRDFTRLSEKEDKVIRRIGKHLLRNEEALFKIWRDFKQGHLRRDDLQRLTIPIQRRVGEYLEQGSYTDPKLKAARFCKNLLENFDALWTFLSVENIEPTNNHAERCLRHAVIWRKNYFCTRSDYGSEFVARTSSIVMTCRLQSKNSFLFISQTLKNYFLKLPSPVLVSAVMDRA